MGTLGRLVLLLGAVLSIGYGGYWTIKHDLHQLLHALWTDLVFFVQTFDITVVIRAAMIWVKKMGAHWLLIEVPKRVIIISFLPYVVLWLLPPRQRRRFKLWIQRKRLILLASRDRFMAWLRAEHMFGDYAGWAIGLLFALIFFIFFYSAFWVYLALWLGFIKIPALVTTLFSYLWGKILFLAQKIPFANLLFKWVNGFSALLARFMPRFRRRTPAERKRRAIARVEYVIRKRYDRQLFMRVGWREYHRLKKAERLAKAAKAAEQAKAPPQPKPETNERTNDGIRNELS